jgi:hypothetical protein
VLNMLGATVDGGMLLTQICGANPSQLAHACQFRHATTPLAAHLSSAIGTLGVLYDLMHCCDQM